MMITRHYRLGAIGVTLITESETWLAAYDAIYAPFAVPRKAPSNVTLTLRAAAPGHVSIGSGDAEDTVVEADADQIYPELEARINQCVIAGATQFLQFHAGVLSRNGQGVILPADSGTGKTSLTAALIARGWQFLSDEFALIDPATGWVHPFPKALCVKDHGRRLLADSPLAGDLARVFTLRGRYRRCYVRPWQMGRGALGGCCPVRWMFYLSRKPEVGAGLFEPTASEAVVYTYRTGLNTLACGQAGFETTLRLVEGAEAWQLNIGDLGATCALLDAVLEGGPEVARQLARRRLPRREAG